MEEKLDEKLNMIYAKLLDLETAFFQLKYKEELQEEKNRKREAEYTIEDLNNEVNNRYEYRNGLMAEFKSIGAVEQESNHIPRID